MKKVFFSLLIALLISLPFFVKSQYFLSLMITLFIYVILAESWSLLGGYTGQVSLGHGAFFGVGALVATAHPTPVLFAMGAATALLGEILRIWAAGHLVKSVRLVTSGPYAHTQHPLYLGRLLILTGLVVAAFQGPIASLVILGVGYAGFFLYYLPRKIHLEGARLALRHGSAFEQYRKSVPVLLPSLRARPPAAPGSWSIRALLRSREPLFLAGLILVFGVLLGRL